MYETIHIFVDPAAGGPSSDYGILTVTLWRGMVTVRDPPNPSILILEMR